ncbi:endonuclease domain-containing protein [Nakamurella sp.]|uniref:endonuclease domain-containing protein n=1 Tax=Nakamurella sp. TaxID=1869182 RepID=UPI0037849CDA
MPRPPDDLPPDLKAIPFTLAQGRALGLSKKRMRRQDLDRPARGVRRAVRPEDRTAESVWANADAALRERCSAVELAVPDGAFFSHLTAARLWPLPLPGWSAGAGPVHVAVMEPAMSPRLPDVVGHRLSHHLISTVQRNGFRLVDPATLFCQLAAVLALPDLVAVGDALILGPRFPDPVDERPYLALADLVDRVDRACGRGTVKARRAVGLVRQGAESRPETLVRLAIVEAGLPEPEINIDVRAADGTFIGRGDMVYRRYRVIVEYDGDHHRTDTRQYDRDVGRLDLFAAHGWRVVRLTGRAFSADRGACLARIEQALTAGGWRRAPAKPSSVRKVPLPPG